MLKNNEALKKYLICPVCKTTDEDVDVKCVTFWAQSLYASCKYECNKCNTVNTKLINTLYIEIKE